MILAVIRALLSRYENRQVARMLRRGFRDHRKYVLENALENPHGEQL